MEKVAFLNLTYNSFNQNNIWKRFFDDGDESKFNLYIHPKIKRPSVFFDYYIKNRVSTGWGKFSLVEATIELIKAALEDEDNEYFVLISESHFPLYDLNSTVDLIKERYEKTTFSKHFSFDTKVKSQKIFREGVQDYKFDEYNAVCQFFVLRRKDAIEFVQTFNDWSKYFVKNKVILADEFYFWGIAKELGMDFDMGQATTYSDWSIRRDSKGHAERNPRVFKKLSKGMVDTYRDKGYLFVRKIMPQTLVMVDPLIF